MGLKEFRTLDVAGFSCGKIEIGGKVIYTHRDLKRRESYIMGSNSDVKMTKNGDLLAIIPEKGHTVVLLAVPKLVPVDDVNCEHFVLGEITAINARTDTKCFFFLWDDGNRGEDKLIGRYDMETNCACGVDKALFKNEVLCKILDA